MAPPLLTTTPHQREDVSALDTFNVHRCPTLWVFIDTSLEQGKPRSDTYTTRLPRPCIHVDSLPNRQTCKALGCRDNSDSHRNAAVVSYAAKRKGTEAPIH
ncbi:hypothetical protein TNCV_3315801 [Trichonephila clavipes]|nr:hypothetical protein TNCV_3315801 [Trichonephila clavipes]